MIIHDICYQVGQALIDRDCKSKCECQESGLVKCDKLSCAANEVCDVREGVRGCHLKQAKCSISYSGHLKSFDGIFGPVGTKGAFVLASLCNEETDLWFRVVVDIRVCNEGSSPTVSNVYVFFNETTVAVNSKHMTWVRRAERME